MILALATTMVACGGKGTTESTATDSTGVALDSTAVTATDSTTAEIPTEVVTPTENK